MADLERKWRLLDTKKPEKMTTISGKKIKLDAPKSPTDELRTSI